VKRKTFYHISLCFPYLALALAAASIYLTDGFDFFTSANAPGILLGTMYFFLVSAIIWGPLYTWMVVVFLIWGWKRDANQVRQLYLLSPLVLAGAMGIPVLIVDLPTSLVFLLGGFLELNHMGHVMSWLFEEYRLEMSMSVAAAWFFMALICVVIGYAFVGIVLWVERGLKRSGRFKGEFETDSLTGLKAAD